MGFMDRMVGVMMGRMSAEEREEMMMGMMDKFFSEMGPEEKGKMMREMMPKMMAEMMGGGGMMEMMKMCCGGGEGEQGFNPMEMCKSMMESVAMSCELAAYATPEVRALFEDWTEEVSSEILQFEPVQHFKSLIINRLQTQFSKSNPKSIQKSLKNGVFVSFDL